MKHNNSYGALLILAMALIVGAPMIQAQARTQANVPFDFSLDQKLMPAGAYEISSPNGGVLTVRNQETREARLMIEPVHVQASQAAGTPRAKWVFHKYGDQYFLAEIWDGQGNIGVALPESKREKEVKLASNNGPQPELVVIAMK